MRFSTATVIPTRTIDWTALSTSSRWTTQQIGVRLLLGYTEREIVASLGRSPAFVDARLEALRVEILEL